MYTYKILNELYVATTFEKYNLTNLDQDYDKDFFSVLILKNERPINLLKYVDEISHLGLNLKNSFIFDHLLNEYINDNYKSVLELKLNMKYCFIASQTKEPIVIEAIKFNEFHMANTIIEPQLIVETVDVANKFNFLDNYFNSEVIIKEVRVLDNVNIKNNTFLDNIILNKCRFNLKLKIVNTEMNHLIIKDCIIDDVFLLNDCSINTIDCNHLRIKNSFEMTNNDLVSFAFSFSNVFNNFQINHLDVENIFSIESSKFNRQVAISNTNLNEMVINKTIIDEGFSINRLKCVNDVVLSNLDLKNPLKFNRVNIFNTLSIIDCHCYDEIVFDQVQDYKIEIINCTFERYQEFKSHFKKSFTCMTSVFEKKCSILDAVFDEVIKIDGCDFQGRFYIKDTLSKAKIFFNGNIFEKRAVFKFKAMENVYFHYINFMNELVLDESEFNGILEFEQVNFGGHTDLRKLETKGLSLAFCTIQNTLDLRFEKVRIYNDFYFIENDIYGYIYLELPFLKKDNFEDIIKKYHLESQKHYYISMQYNTLKVNANKIGNFDEEDRLYALYKHHDVLSKWYGENTNGNVMKFKTKVRAVSEFILFGALSRYGTSLSRILISCLLVIVGFGTIYRYTGLIFNNEIQSHFLAAYYFSMVTFFTIGFGDILPNSPVAAFLAGFEGFLGLTMISYFTIVFARRVIR